MKTFKNFHKGLVSDDLTEYEDIPIEEGILRNISGIGIMNKIRTISKKIESIGFLQRDDEVDREKKLMLQNHLISKQNFYIGLLITSMGILKK
jgi:hypothetical protein